MNIIPTVFVKKGSSFLERFGKVLPLANRIHVDFMDGLFVKNKSVPPMEIPDLQGYTKEFEAHLMVKFPEHYIEVLRAKGFKRVIFHYESQHSELDVKYIVALIRKNKMIPVLAINPDTNIDVCFPLIRTVSHYLIMGVIPGEEKQEFLSKTISKVLKLREKSKSIIIQVDGGITPSIAKKLFLAGCDFINSGSYISDAPNPIIALKKIQEAINE